MSEFFATLVDHAINRSSGVYTGFTPGRPNELVIPQFVALEESLSQLTDALSRYLALSRLRRPLVLADEVTWEIAGRELFEGLEDAGCDPRTARVSSNAWAQAEAVVEEMSHRPRMWSGEEHPWERRLYAPKVPSVVFGVGGGTVIDLAKLVAFQLHVPCISVPTSLANDGIASPFAVIRPEREGLPANVTVRTHTPLGILVDLGRIRPRDEAARSFFRRMMQSGVGDAVSNLTSTLDWRLAAREGRARLDYLALLHARSAGEGVLYRINRGATENDDDLVLTLAAGLVSSGEAMSRVGSSRPASGFEHKLYHAWENVLRLPSRATHGILVAVGSLVSARVHGQWYASMREGFSRIGLPVDTEGLAALGIEPEPMERAIRTAREVKPERYTVLEHVGPERMVAAFREVYGA